MYKDILDIIVDMVKLNTSYAVVVGSNPTKESIAVTGFSYPFDTYLDRDTEQTYDVTINGKSGDQEALLRELSSLHRKLTLRKDFPHSDRWQIVSIDTTASPRLIGVEEAERTRYIYGSSLTVKYYALGMRGEKT
jgi:hypothetical protein